MRRLGVLAAALGAAMAGGACGGEPGADGTDIPVAYEQLAGGIVFATSRIPGSAGYDLYFIPFPNPRITTGELGFIRLTSTTGNEWQPSAAANGRAIAFVKEFEIHVITSSGRIKKVSDTSGGNFKDSLPAVSADAQFVAWVREDLDQPIGDTGFFETVVMMATIDGTNAEVLDPRPGVIQDAPAFDPARQSSRLAWSEFAATTLDPVLGPQDYGVRIFDFVAKTGSLVCQSQNGRTPGTENLQPRPFAYRCFGQHLIWPTEDTLMLGQDQLQIRLRQGNRLESIWSESITAIQRQVMGGSPALDARGDGFFPAFPLSVSHSPNTGQIVFDGLIEEVDGNRPTLAMYASDLSGMSPFRIRVSGLRNDLDTANTAGFLFSVATPQVIPFPTE